MRQLIIKPNDEAMRNRYGNIHSGVRGSFQNSNPNRNQDFDYRGPDYFNRNPGVQDSLVFGNHYGRHHGKGPKNYKRSDERICEDINDALTEAPDIDASEIEFEVNDGLVKLKGTVEEKSQKRSAENVIEHIRGVTSIENHLRTIGPKHS